MWTVTKWGRPADSLNEVRPRRPEQWTALAKPRVLWFGVSMKSGLEGRNNFSFQFLSQ